MPNKERISRFAYTRRGPKPLSISKKAELDISKYQDMLKRGHEELVRGIENKQKKARLLDFC